RAAPWRAAPAGAARSRSRGRDRREQVGTRVLRLEREQGALALEPAGIAREAAVGAHDPVARHDDADRILAGGGADGARARAAARAARELAVADGLAVAHAGDRAPDRALERRAPGRERQLEARACPGEVLRELREGVAQRR